MAAQVKVTLVKSLAGQLHNIAASVRGLGLRKPQQTVTVNALAAAKSPEDIAAKRGKSVEEILG